MILKEFQEIDGIKIFHGNIDANHPDYNLDGLDALYREEEKHFWFISRKEFIYEKIKPVVNPESSLIEIGAGTGNVSRYLKNKGFRSISVGEMHRKGLMYAKLYGIEKCYQFDLLRSPFRNEFDVVCLFDVLEHIDDDALAIENVSNMLVDRGVIVITVPAHMWLWCSDDVVAGHKRRYVKKDLEHLLTKHGFEIIVIRYFFIMIVPLLFLRRIIYRDRLQLNQEVNNVSLSINPIINKILLAISRLENHINRFIPNIFGGSLLVIASKK